MKFNELNDATLGGCYFGGWIFLIVALHFNMLLPDFNVRKSWNGIHY